MGNKGSNPIQNSTSLRARHFNSHAHSAHGREYGQFRTSFVCSLFGPREVRRNRTHIFMVYLPGIPFVKIYLFISTCKCLKKIS